MSINKSPLAFDDVKALLDRALKTQKGIQVKFETRPQALVLLRRLYECRRIERAQAAQIYPVGHPMHPFEGKGSSNWDALSFLVHGTSVKIFPYSANVYDIEELE